MKLLRNTVYELGVSGPKQHTKVDIAGSSNVSPDDLRCRDGAIEREFEYGDEAARRRFLHHVQPHGSRGECEDTATEVNNVGETAGG
jgi:hypothetical protein